MSTDEVWTDSFMRVATDFLAEHYDIIKPDVNVNCELTCPWASECHYMACYMPWINTVNFRSGSEYGFIAAHEFGHALQKAGLLTEGEAPAIEMERWWSKNVNELSCEICGAPLFVSEDTLPGTEIVCKNCGSVYEAVPIH